MKVLTVSVGEFRHFLHSRQGFVMHCYSKPNGKIVFLYECVYKDVTILFYEYELRELCDLFETQFNLGRGDYIYTLYFEDCFFISCELGSNGRTAV